ncbi:MAG TPA: T9SS type A sorting domain-containing protein [Flavobacterium sp.]|jgi:uncharacterized repeat protein (TIGR01451 family)
MKQKLLIFQFWHFLPILFCAVASGQQIGIPNVNASGGPVTISFTVTNGTGSANFYNEATEFIVYLSDASGTNFNPVHTFHSTAFPQSASTASATITTVVPLPEGTPAGTGYRIAIGSTMPSSTGNIGGNASATFTVFSALTMPSTLNGFIKCSSPSITYYVLTITNTGNVPDSFTLTKVQSLYPLGSVFYSLTGASISSTPVIGPGESYTFMMRFDTPNGTPPDNWNTTVVTATSVNTLGVFMQTNISTYIYCGNNNSSLPNSPDMEIVKTASTATATVGEFIDYTITIRNATTRNASNPVIKDFIPANAQLISYNKAPGETRTVVFNHNSASNTLTAVVNGTMTSASLPLTIMIRVKTICQSVPQVINSAEVYSVSGDSNSLNDVSSATTAVDYSGAGSDIGRWTGSYSSDWFDCRNWNGGVVPNNNTDVIIPGGTPNSEINYLSPLAPADKIARAHDLSITSGATVSITNAGLLHIAGNWASHGGFTAGNGTVTFMGSTSGIFQTISDSTEKTEFYNLVVNSSGGGKGLSVPDGFGVFVHNNLNLIAADIRLNGKSQLIQTKPGQSGNTIAGTGKLLVDQQGQSNMFSYNYWSSPVGVSNSYSVGAVLLDGTNPLNPQNITWTASYNVTPTTPITMSAYWINKYQNQSGNYASWSSIGQNGILSAGQGFTMKGSGATTPFQNYTFAGKPNNGNFVSAVSANNMNLSGNPYPSALDAYAFIDDNEATTTGTLYFWEQFPTNSSHVTANYEGGYATLTKTGATPPAAPEGVSSSGSSERMPGRYIPIAQGFLLFGSATGGTITFSNTQRAFVRETDQGLNPMFRSEKVSEDRKIRLDFASTATGARRQLLLGFMDGRAGDSFDYGYDAIQIDTRDNDIYFPLEDKKLVIEARGAFNEAAAIPVAVTIGQAGEVTFKLAGFENFPSGSYIFLHDAATQTSYDLTGGPAAITIEEGTFNERFTLRFKNAAVPGDVTVQNLWVNYTEASLNIHNTGTAKINSVALFSISGRQVFAWEFAGQTGNFQLPASGLSAGVYFARVQSNTGTIVKKIFIK